jgi:hypothetical protein
MFFNIKIEGLNMKYSLIHYPKYAYINEYQLYVV